MHHKLSGGWRYSPCFYENRGLTALVFTVFDRDALYDIKQATDVARQGFNDSGFGTDGNPYGLNIPHDHMSPETNRERWTRWSRPHYSDEIPPLTNLLIA